LNQTYTPTALSTPLPVLSLSTARSIGFTAAQFSTCGAAGIPFPIAPQSLPMTVPPVPFKFDSTVDRACSLTVALFSTCGAPDGTRFATVSPCHHNIGEGSIMRSRLAHANTILLTPPCALHKALQGRTALASTVSHPTSMPGSSYIFGILRCYNERPPDKGRIFSYDADFVVDFDGDEVKVQKALLTRFTPQDSELFVDRAFYSVGGKVATIDSSFDVGGAVNVDDYQLFIEADEVCCALISHSLYHRMTTHRWL
jgi:hypothetical protein